MYRLAILNSHPIQYFAPLYRRIAQEKEIELTVYYCSRKGVEKYEDEGFGVDVEWDVPLLEGYDYRFLSNLRDGASDSGFFGLVNPQIVSELWTERYDALWVHGHNSLTNLMAVLAAKFYGTAVFMRGETHLRLDRPPVKKALRGPVLRMLYGICDACLPIGSRNAEFYRSIGISDDCLFQVPYTVDNEFFRSESASSRRNPGPVRDEYGLPPSSQPLILYASKMTPRKRPMDLLRAFRRLRNRGSEAALVFAGNGVEEERLKTYARDYEMGGVHFLGFVNQSVLPKLYGASDVFVLPSENEPWGLVINEVMAAGLPVVATEEIGAVADLVEHGENGFTYRTGNVSALADHLETLIEDPDLVQTMGHRSREIIEQWSYEECVEGIRQALRSISNK